MGVMSFPGAANLPIVGQPFKFKSWHPTVQIVCQCEAKEPLLLVGLNAVVQCPACKRGFTVLAVNFNAQTGQNQIGIAQVVVEQEKQSS